MDALIISIAVVSIAFAIIMWKMPITRKYWFYIVILSGGLITLLNALLNREKNNEDDSTLKEELNEIKDNLKEANDRAKLEVKVAKEKNAEKMDKVKKISKIKDKTERRKKIADFLNE